MADDIKKYQLPENPVTGWKASSIPLPSDFNRIEGNIAYLNAHKFDKDDILAIEHGGTGANSEEDARSKLGIECTELEIEYIESSKVGAIKSTELSGTTKATANFQKIRIGKYCLYFGTIDEEIASDNWVRFAIDETILEVILTPKRSSLDGYGSICAGYFVNADEEDEKNTVHLGSDYNKCDGIYVMVIASVNKG